MAEASQFEERQISQAWPFDAHLLDEGWTRTRGEEACPTQTFRTIKVEDEEMQRIRAEESREVLKPELGTKRRIYYKNLHLITKCFVGGTVVRHVGGALWRCARIWRSHPKSEFGTLYRPGFALLVCPACQGRMKLLAVVRNPVSIARYLAAAGKLSDGAKPPLYIVPKSFSDLSAIPSPAPASASQGSAPHLNADRESLPAGRLRR